MKRKPLVFPCISHELQFVATNSDEFYALLDDTIQISQDLKTIAEKVAEKADINAEEIVAATKNVLSHETESLLHIGWGNFSSNSWQIYGDISARRSKKKIGLAGFNIGSGQERFRLIGWARSFGGLKGLQDLKHACRKVPGVHLASEQSKRYPGWIGNNNAVVWLDLKLNSKTCFDDMQKAIAQTAKPFFKTAKSAMQALV